MTVVHWLAMVGMLLQGLDARGRHTAPLADHVRLSLSSEREAHYRSETLRLHIAAKNTSEGPVTAYFQGLNPLFRRTRVYFRHGGATQFRELDLLAEMPSTIPDHLQGIRTVRGPGRKTLYPGQQYDVEVSLSFVVENGARRFVLDQVGHYEFKLTYADTPMDPNGILESNVLAIEVVEPPPSERQAQAAYTPDLAYVAQLHRSQALSIEDTRSAAGFVARFPDSRYAVAVKQALRSSLAYRKERKTATEEEQGLYQSLFGHETYPPPPPRLDVIAAPGTLWPADNSMVPITMWATVTDHRSREDPTADVVLESITCDDSCDLANAVAGADFGRDDREFQLRAERGGSAAGRTYTVTYAATTAGGHRLARQETVTVPAFTMPPPWSATKGEDYRGGDVVTYQGELWRCVGRIPSHPRFAPAPDSYVWKRVPQRE